MDKKELSLGEIAVVGASIFMLARVARILLPVDGLGRTSYVPSGGAAVEARARANLSRSSRAQRNVHTAQRMRSKQASAWKVPTAQKPGREPKPWRTAIPRPPLNFEGPLPGIRPTPMPSPRPAPPTAAPAPRPVPVPPKAPAPKAPAPTGPKEPQPWFDALRKRPAPQKAPVKIQAPSDGKSSKLNPLIIAGAAALIPIFGAMA